MCWILTVTATWMSRCRSIWMGRRGLWTIRIRPTPASRSPGYPDLPIVDMGAYEFQAGPAYDPGDLNCDGVVSPADIDPFVIALDRRPGGV
jgi:hypothetical protein